MIYCKILRIRELGLIKLLLDHRSVVAKESLPFQENQVLQEVSLGT